MPLTECKECNAKISDKAKTCPKCGCPDPFKVEEDECAECKELIPKESDTCPECGHPEPFEIDAPADPSSTSSLSPNMTNESSISDKWDSMQFLEKLETESLIVDKLRTGKSLEMDERKLLPRIYASYVNSLEKKAQNKKDVWRDGIGTVINKVISITVFYFILKWFLVEKDIELSNWFFIGALSLVFVLIIWGTLKSLWISSDNQTTELAIQNTKKGISLMENELNR